MKVLVVEDDPFVRIVTVEALEDAGFEVLEAATAEEALARYDEQLADVLVTDIQLGGEIDGWDIAEHCRRIDASLPVIYASGYSPKEHRRVPGSRFFQKPYRAQQVIEAVRELVRHRRGSS